MKTIPDHHADYKMPRTLKKNFRLSAPALMRIWEIHSRFKCPVVGTCLTLDENRRLLKKGGCRVKRLSPFRLHTALMEQLHRENPVSLKTDNYLRHKYRESIAEFAHLPEDEFMEIWRKQLRTGEIEAIFFIAAVRPDLSEKTLIEIFGEIHMMGHANTAEIIGLRREAACQDDANQRLGRLLAKEKKENSRLKKALAEANADLSKARMKIKQLQAVSASSQVRCEDTEKQQDDTVLALEKKIQETEIRNRQLARDRNRIEREKRKLQIEMFELRSVNQHLAEEAKALIAQFSELTGGCSGENCSECCPEYPICAKRVLVVGGITRIRHLYRDLIESAGGKFDYHDGYMKNAKQNIEAQVKRSDLVICPVTCNSHGACDKVKRLCRKYDKPIRMLPSAGLSAISSALLP